MRGIMLGTILGRAAVLGLALCAARASAATCTAGFYTLAPDEHAPACLFHATFHNACPRENEATDLVYLPYTTGKDKYLQNGTGSSIELSAEDCASQFRTHLYLFGGIGNDTSAPQNITLNNDPDHAPYAASYPYILLDGAFVQGAVFTLKEVDIASGNKYYQITHIEPLVAQKAQPHGIRKADELDHTVCYAGLGSAGGLFLLLILALAIRCRSRPYSEEDKYSA
jgi:hypothetical protein